MKKSALYFGFVTSLIMWLVACGANPVPFIEAKHYFVNNQIERLPDTPITTQTEFDSLFGAATLMGKDGKPTAIDFSKEYVIAVNKPATNRATVMTPLFLKRMRNGELQFTYRTVVGEEQSYTTVPCLLIVVSKDYLGKVEFNEVL